MIQDVSRCVHAHVQLCASYGNFSTVQHFPQHHSSRNMKFSGSYRYTTLNQCGWKRCTSTIVPAKHFHASAHMLIVQPCALRGREPRTPAWSPGNCRWPDCDAAESAKPTMTSPRNPQPASPQRGGPLQRPGRPR